MSNFADRFRAKTAAAPTEDGLTAEQQVLLAEFEKAASANGIDISELSEEDVGSLFEEFLADLQNAADDAEAPADKIAQAQNLIVLREFEKAAAAAELDLNSLTEEQLQEAFAVWLDGSVEDIAQEDEAKIASAKLAEVEVLGEHMAEVFIAKVNEGLNKEAGVINSGANAAKGRLRSAIELARTEGKDALTAIRANKGKAVGAAAATTAAGAGGMYARSKMKDKTASAIAALVEISRAKNGQ